MEYVHLRYLPTGNFTRKYDETGCQMSCATYTIEPSQLYWDPTKLVSDTIPKTEVYDSDDLAEKLRLRSGLSGKISRPTCPVVEESTP
jgi:hypothetical protein